MDILLIAVAILVLIVVVFVLIWNTLIRLRARIDNAWAQIDVQLKRRADLIPNLIETVKGYMKHEKTVLENITKARAALVSASGPRELARAEAGLAGALKTLFAVAENYPNLRASENFKMLQEELSGTESKIAYARQLYNDTVLDYNTKIQTIPYNIIAQIFGFTAREYFKVESEAERKAVKVKFD
ncbi:MAG: LemA family protein [Candidatus Micrarchaeia archaeon]